MPTVRYQIRNEYGLADPEVYRAANKDDPEALLEGVALAGMVGVLRQLGDLAEFAAEVFHNLHEEVMVTSARGHGLMLRVLQLEAEFPSIEKAILSETDHSHCAYSAGIDWHANLRIDQNLVSQGDMPRFILDSYEECRGPPRLFMLDKFDVAGAGACLTRYSNPSFFKTASAFSEMMEEAQREKRARKPKKKVSYWRSGETTESFLTPIIEYLQFTDSEPAHGKFPARLVKLKHRKLRVSDISCRKSYMEGFLIEESFEQNDSKNSLRGCPNNKTIDGSPEEREVLIGGVTDPSLVRKEFSPLSLKEEVTGKVQNKKREDGDFLETVSISSCVSQKNYPNSQNDKESILVGLGNEADIHAFDSSSDEIDTNTSPLQLAVQNNILAVSGFITDDDHDSYRSDDIGSELENYVDALNTMESEIEIDSENRAKADQSLFKHEYNGTNPDVNGQLELQPLSSRSGIVGSFDKSLTSEKVKDGMPSLSQSAVLVDLPVQQLMMRTAFEETASLEINHGGTGKLERTSEDMTLVPSAYLTSNETCYQKQPNATMVIPVSREDTRNCITDSDLKSQPNIEEEQSLAAHSDEAISGITKITPEIDEHVESSFLPWQINHIVVIPSCKEHPDFPTDILEEINPIEYSEDRISVNMTDKGYMPDAFSEAEHGILSEKASVECSKDLSTLLDDGIRKPLEVLEPDKNDYISGSSLPTIHMSYTVLESQDTSNDLEIDMQSENLVMKISSNYMEDKVEERKLFDSSVLFSADSHKLPLVENDSGSHGSTQTSENVNDVLACIPDEGGSPHGSRNNLEDQLSGYTEQKMSNDFANTLEMPQPQQTQAECSLLDVSFANVKDSLDDSVENDKEAYSVEHLLPKYSAFSLEIVSSILQSESFSAEIGNISATQKDFVHPQLPSSSGNIDIVGCDALISPTIQHELEHILDVDELQESSNGVMLKPMPSSFIEDPDANQLHREVSELIETNEEERVHDGLEFANSSTNISVQHDLLLLGGSKNNLLTGNGIPIDSINAQVLNMLESSQVTTFDDLLQEDPLSENDMLHQPYPDIEEPDITRDSTSLPSENKSYLLFTENEEMKMFFNSVSRSQSSALDLSNSSESELIDVKEDKLCSRENEQDSDSKSENVITEDDTDGNLSLLQSSNVCNLDVQFQEDPVSEDAVLNLQKPVIEELNGANSGSKFNIVTQDETDGQILHLLESSNLYSFDLQIQEDLISEDASLNQHKQEIQEPAIESDLTSLKIESKLLASLCENGDQKAVGILSSSQLQALDLSDFTHAKLADNKFDVHMVESVVTSREDEQHSDSDASIQHFQTDAQRPEVPSKNASVSLAGDESSTLPLYRVLENIEPSYVHLDEVSSDEPTINQYNLEHEGLLPGPEPESLLNHGCKNMPSSKTHENEQIETSISVSFHGVSEHPWSCMASEALTSGSLCADAINPIPSIGAQETLNALPEETIPSFPIQEDIEETPPLPPLPPMQWRMGSSMHINPLATFKETMNQHAGSLVSPFAFDDNCQNASSCTDGQLTESLKLSEFPVITMDQMQQPEIYSSGLPLLASSKDGKHSHVIMDGDNPFTVAPSLNDVVPQHPDLLEAGNPQAIGQRRPKLGMLLPGLELERSLEAPIIDRDAIPPLSSFMFMPTAGDGMYQYGYGDYGGYEGDSKHYHNLSAPFPVAVQSIPHYAYHMFLREGNSSTMYDIMLQDMEGDKPNEKHHSILSRPRDPLIEAVAAHDKSTLRKVSELDWPLPKPKEDEKNHLLEQIKTKSLNLKPSTSKVNINAPSTNLKVAAILEKANAIRQACVGSDEEDDDDNWNDS